MKDSCYQIAKSTKSIIKRLKTCGLFSVVTLLFIATFQLMGITVKACGIKASGATFQNGINNPFVADSTIDREKVLKTMEQVADWQIAHQNEVKHDDLDWTNATLYIGMLELSRISENQKYRKWLMQLGEKYGWQPKASNNSIYLADDIAVSQMFLGIYQDEKDERMLFPTQARTEWILNHPSIATLYLDYSDYHTLERWSWCDALFMAPPVYAKMYNITKDVRYLEFMDKEYKLTTNLLYDRDDHLFYRDYRFLDQKSDNGRKIFWARGNGWVLGGLANILKEIPAYSRYRPYYENLFKDMCEKISTLQNGNGYWPVSLLDPGSFPNPETSGSGFFVYALAYGINNGLLDREKYLPIVLKGWKALVDAVEPDGKLDWVQPVGYMPQQIRREMTEVYGVGAFLLAGSEMYRLNK